MKNRSAKRTLGSQTILKWKRALDNSVLIMLTSIVIVLLHSDDHLWSQASYASRQGVILISEKCDWKQTGGYRRMLNDLKLQCFINLSLRSLLWRWEPWRSLQASCLIPCEPNGMANGMELDLTSCNRNPRSPEQIIFRGDFMCNANRGQSRRRSKPLFSMQKLKFNNHCITVYLTLT